MASNVYANAKLAIASGTLGWDDSTQVFRALLVDNTYVYSHVQTTVADISGEVSDVSYFRQDVISRVVNLDLPGDRALLDAADVAFANLANVTPSGMIVYKQVGGDDLTPGNDLLVCFIDFPDSPAHGAGSTFLVRFATDGVIALIPE